MNAKAIVIGGCVSAIALATAFVAGQSITPPRPVVIPPSVVAQAVSDGDAPADQSERIAEITDTAARTADADAEVVREDLARPPISIMAPALAFEFERNEVAANNKYGDRRVRITGAVYSIDDADRFGNPPVAWLQTDAYAANVGAIISRDQAATLQKYRGATFDCLGAEKEFRILAKACTVAQ